MGQTHIDRESGASTTPEESRRKEAKEQGRRGKQVRKQAANEFTKRGERDRRQEEGEEPQDCIGKARNHTHEQGHLNEIPLTLLLIL